MEGSWIISRPLAALGGATWDDAAVNGKSTILLADFAARLETIAARSLDPLAIWRAGEAMDFADLGALGCTLALAPTLGAALRVFQRGFAAVQSASSVDFEVKDDRARFSYPILDNEVWPRRADAELTLGLLTGVILRFAPNARRACSIAFEHEPGESRAALAAHFGMAPRRSEINTISFPIGLLDCKRSERSAPKTSEAFRQAVKGLEAQIQADWRCQPTSHRALHTLMSRIGLEDISQDTIARHMGVSTRTLRRQLDSEGTSFHALTEACRRNVGHALLVRSDLPMTEIAMRLGYSDHTAFSRAFSRWFGASPRELRKAGSAASVTT